MSPVRLKAPDGPKSPSNAENDSASAIDPMSARRSERGCCHVPDRKSPTAESTTSSESAQIAIQANAVRPARAVAAR